MNTLDSIFQWLLAASLRASLLAVAVLGLQFVLRRWLPARWRHALWLPMIFVLVAPVLPTSRWSVQNRFEPPALVRTTLWPAGAVKTGPDTAAEIEKQTGLATPTPEKSSIRQVLLGIWLAGAFGVLGAGAIGYRRSLRRMEHEAVETDAVLAEFVAGMARQLKLRRVPRVIVSAAIGGPAVAGLLHPKLLLPEGFPAGFSNSETRLILLHELTHLKRHDLLLNWLLCFVQGLHWFNPALWFAFARMRADREMACDAQVLATDIEDRRADYGSALLKLQSAVPQSGLSLAFVGIFERSAGTRSRICAIAGFRRTHGAWRIAVAVGIALMTALGATRAQSATALPKMSIPSTRKSKPGVALEKSPPIRFHGPMIEIEANFIEVPEATWRQMAATGSWEVVRGQREWSRLVASMDRQNQESLIDSWFGKKVAANSGGFLQLVSRALSEKIGVDLLSTPRVTTHSKQTATIEIIREFHYPTAWKPGEKKEDAWVPTNYAVKNTGVSLEALPTLATDGTIDLRITPQVVEFEGFKDIGHGRKPPVFSERKVQANVTLRSGQTVILGGAIREDQQMVEDKIPVLGDVPLLGRLFRSSQKQTVKRCLLVVVTPRILPKE